MELIESVFIRNNLIVAFAVVGPLQIANAAVGMRRMRLTAQASAA